jgi:hypothetical protein
MPKRVVDGDALWRSDKLLEVPERFRPEFANLIPLAYANGTFECNPKRVWSLVYSFNRPDVSPEDVEVMLNEFERVKMLFRWKADDGKFWALWVGVEKAGRLPAPSRKQKEKMGEPVPKEKLRNFLQNTTGYPEGSRGVAEGYHGFGSGSGFGVGSGFGADGVAMYSASRSVSPESAASVPSVPETSSAKKGVEL